MRKIEVVHVDLDGVCADFDLRYFELFGSVAKQDPNKILWKRIEDYETAGGRWFYDLPLMPDALDLMNGLKERGIPIRILTATGMNYHPVTKQKIEWCAKQFGIKREDITTVRKSEHKAQFATPRSVLIDDSERSVLPFIQAGGHGIMHYSAEASLAHLDTLIAKHGRK